MSSGNRRNAGKGCGAEPVARSESAIATAARRTLSISLYALLFLLTVALSPLLLPLAAVVDVARGRSWPLLRVVAFFCWYLACELVGVAASFAVWLTSGPWTGTDARRYLERNYALQRWWSETLGRGAFSVFGVDVRVEGGESLAARPIVLLLRHASVADTILASLLVANRHGIRLRYVLKRELLWDPCLDIVGNRVPNVFIDRSAPDGAAEVAALGRLMDGLGIGDGVLIYPEGTRFSEEKRGRLLARLSAAGDTAALERALSFRHVLPPRPRGTLELLARNRGADVVFCAHTGFEASASFWDLYNGGLVGRTVRVRFRRVPFAEIPSGEEARRRWLDEQWHLVDQFVATASDV